jgi:hypothetical protein
MIDGFVGEIAAVGEVQLCDFGHIIGNHLYSPVCDFASVQVDTNQIRECGDFFKTFISDVLTVLKLEPFERSETGDVIKSLISDFGREGEEQTSEIFHVLKIFESRSDHLTSSQVEISHIDHIFKRFHSFITESVPFQLKILKCCESLQAKNVLVAFCSVISHQRKSSIQFQTEGRGSQFQMNIKRSVSS